ncbi:hypothetical protein BDF19DRAFT_239592 [Syncephalis fuscata]|nr:hypothetical protein BDF19DRAFT_239592 [Syncephalis fuscata]
MPFINYTSPDYNEWMNSDIKQLGARLHPLGEKNIFDFFMESSDGISKQRLRLFGMQFLMALEVVLFWTFVRNLVIASRMVIMRPRNMVSWLCLIPSALNSIIALVMVLMYTFFQINCRTIIWISSFNIAFMMVGNSLILLQKAYLVLCRQKWILYVSAPAIAAQLAYPLIVIYFSFISFKETTGCTIYYLEVILWYWFAVNVPINLLFSAIFCHIALKQYRSFGSEAWKKLARDGIQTMLLATLCSIICSVVIISSKNKINADTLFVVDSVVVTTILINHCRYFGKSTKYTHRPKTEHILHLN